VISCFLFTPNFGFTKTAFHQLDHGSSIASDNIAPLMLPVNQCEQVALLCLLKLALQ
jgi:hypothetical protein